VTKDIAATLDNCEIVPIQKPDRFTESYERISFVFPIFAMGLPMLVERFLKGVDLGGNKDAYFFTITTCGAHSGNAIGRV